MSHVPLPPFAAYAGSRQPRILLVGEAWGESEDMMKEPFCGEAGKELFRMLGEAMPEIEPELHQQISELHRYGSAWVKDRGAWFQAAGIGMTNVLAFRPPGNKLEVLCGTKKEVGGDGYHHPPITKGKYLHPEYLGELQRLRDEIESVQPNLVLALGNTASWATLNATNIGSIRGTVAAGAPGGPANGRKVLPTYHPAGVLRQWSWRTIVVADLMKASREAAFPEIRRPERKILINPTLEEVRNWFARVLYFARDDNHSWLIAADTETEGGQIRCISFAWDTTEAIVVPFWDKTKPGWSYWAEHEEEQVWQMVQDFMESPRLNFLWQNGMYDFQYVLPMKIKVHRSTQDTMLLHHSMYPEMQKGLGFLGSLYTNEASWKLMRKEKTDSEKRDE